MSVAVNVIVPPAPDARLAAVAVRLVVLVLKPSEPLTVAPTKVSPAALRLSVRVTLAAALGVALAAAGATAVQLYSAMVYAGPELPVRIARDLAAILKANGFANVRQAVGTA